MASGSGADDVEWWTGSKARVFISCGQSTSEGGVAGRIRDLVRELGFCPYFAVEAHSSKAITEGIYQRLATAEYFLFADFPRSEPGGFVRGSLFSNQELGIASYLELEFLPFLHQSLPLEGILKYIQGNPVRFSSEEDLLEKIRRETRAAGWNPTSRRELEILRDPREFTNAAIPATSTEGQQGWAPVRYYHLAVRNRHWRLMATDCIVHLLGVRKVASGEVAHPDTVELKFKHVTSQSISLPPSSAREFDGVLVPEAQPSMAVVGILNPTGIDSASIVEQHKIQGPGDFELDLAAYSRGFRPARAIVRLHLGTSLDDVRLEMAPVRPPDWPLTAEVSKEP